MKFFPSRIIRSWALALAAAFALLFSLLFLFRVDTSASKTGSSDGTPVASAPQIASTFVINEFAPSGAEWVELYNGGTVTLTISGWYVGRNNCGSGTSFIGFQDVAPGAFFLVNSGDAGDSFSLNNSGGVVVLCDNADMEIDRVGYGFAGGAPAAPSAVGSSQYSAARTTDGADTDDDASDWNLDPTPTPGSSNDVPGNNLGASLVINEVDFAFFPGVGNDHVELYNPTSQPVAVSGWYLSDGDDVAVLGSGLTVTAGGYLVLEEGVDWTSEGTNGMDFGSIDVAYLFDDNRVRIDQLGWLGGVSGDCVARVPDGSGPNDSYNWSSAGGGVSLFARVCSVGGTNGNELVVSKVGPATALFTETIAYRITIDNLGPQTATNVLLTDTLPVKASPMSQTIVAGLVRPAPMAQAAPLCGRRVMCLRTQRSPSA